MLIESKRFGQSDLRARDSVIKTRDTLPPKEIGYQVHDGQDREPPPHHGPVETTGD